MRIIKQLVTTEDIQDLEGWTIRKDTIVVVVNDCLPQQPFGRHDKLIVCKIDNGTGDLKLMPESFIFESILDKYTIENNDKIIVE